jgi:uncharacterized membrane protein
MDKTQKNWLLGIIITLVVLAIISFIIAIAAKQSILNSFRIVFGSVYVLFIPGFIISYIFFPKTREFEENKHEHEREKGAIDWIERIALSFALSIAIVPLAVFYLNLIGVKINLINSFLTILGISIIAGIILFIKMRMKK